MVTKPSQEPHFAIFEETVVVTPNKDIKISNPKIGFWLNSKQMNMSNIRNLLYTVSTRGGQRGGSRKKTSQKDFRFGRKYWGKTYA